MLSSFRASKLWVGSSRLGRFDIGRVGGLGYQGTGIRTTEMEALLIYWLFRAQSIPATTNNNNGTTLATLVFVGLSVTPFAFGVSISG